MPFLLNALEPFSFLKSLFSCSTKTAVEPLALREKGLLSPSA